MHEAYTISNILQLTVQIECIAVHGNILKIITNNIKFAFALSEDTLFLGTRQGHLYMYYIVPKDDKPDVSLMRLNKSFCKKAIQQLGIIPEHQLLISLSGMAINSIFSLHMLFILCPSIFIKQFIVSLKMLTKIF